MDVAIFIDLDNTLLNTEIVYSEQERSRVKGTGWAPYNADSEEIIYRSQLRPYTEEFLLELGSNFSLYLLTSGDRIFQTHILKQHRINHYFAAIFGRQDITQAINLVKPLVPGKPALLVDDLPPGSIGFNQKFKAIGILPDELGDFSNLPYSEKNALLSIFANTYYIMVPCYFGKSPDLALPQAFPVILDKAEQLSKIS